MLDIIGNAMVQYVESNEKNNGGLISGINGGLNEVGKAIVSLINILKFLKWLKSSQNPSAPSKIISAGLKNEVSYPTLAVKRAIGKLIENR